MTDHPLEVRRLRACLAVLLSYLLIAWLVLVVFWLSTGMGVLLADVQRDTLRLALGGHSTALAIVGLGYIATRSATGVPPWASRLVLALLPFLFLVSMDRIAAVTFAPPTPPGILTGHPTRGWTNQRSRVAQVGQRKYRLNAHGLRGPEIPKQKADDEIRILFLGDSIAFGIGVEESDTFVRQVERLFATSHPGAHITTINCSVSGYAPWQQLDLLRTEGLDFEPDLVVQVFCLNDVGEKYNLRQFGGLSRGLEPEPVTALDWSGLYQALRHTVGDWVTGTKARVKARQALYSVKRLLAEPSAPEFVDAWASMLDDFGTMELATRKRGIPLAIVSFPYAEQLSPHMSYENAPQHRLQAYAEQNRIPFLDLTPMYRAFCRSPEVATKTARGWEGLAVLPDRVHPLPPGHHMAAKAMHRWISQILWPGDSVDEHTGRN